MKSKPHCTQHYGYVGADVAIAGVSGVAVGGAIVTMGEEDSSNDKIAAFVLALGVAAAAVHVASAASGASAVGQCRNAIAAWGR